MANLHLIKHKSRLGFKSIVNLCQRALTALALLYSMLGHAQFSGSFDPSNWSTVQVNGGNGSINAGGAPATIALTSPNGTNAGAFTYYQITPPCAGTITFDWSVAHTDPSFDVFGYSINGANSFLANTTTSGSVSISVAYGQTFAFYGDGADGCCGSLTSTISNFTFTSSSLLFISSAVLSGTCSGQDTLFLTYQKCGAAFGGGNIFTVELSDTAGSFGSSTTILTVASTSSSGTFAIPIPSATIGSANYLVRISSTSPALTSSSVAVPEFFSKPPTPTWVFSQPYGQCADSTMFIDTVGNQYTTQTYPIGLANVSTNNTACGDNGPYSCAGPISVTWTDAGSGSIISGTFSINYTLNCGAGDVLTFTLNGNSQGTQTLTLNDCACSEGGSGAQILTVNINPSDFNAGGSNTMVITNSSGNCFGVNTTGSLGGGAAQVSIIGYPYIAQYSFDSSFTTIVASGDTSIFNPGANTSVYVRYLNVAEGCSSYAALKPIIMDTGIYITSINVTGQCAGNDSIIVSYDNCNAAFGGGNTLAFQLSDTFGNFSTFTSLGSIATAINSDTISLAIPASVYSGSNYKIRVVSSSPSDTSEIENVPELFAKPSAPTWVFSSQVNICENDSVTFYDTVNQAGGSGTTTYSLGLGSITTNNAACGDNGPYSCSGPITITWNDTGFGNLSSGNFSINASLNCNIGDALGFSLNGNPQGTATISLNDCSCSEFGNGSQILTVGINPADYVIGGTNSMVITMTSGNCVGINTSGALGGGAAQVDLEFSSGDIAQYSFDSNFTTIVAFSDTATFSVGNNTSVFVRTFNQTTGCTSATVEKSISFLPCDAPGAGYTVQYDGTNDYATLAAQPTTATNNFSIEGWVYPLSFSGTNNLILYNGNTSTNGWGLMANGSGLLQILFGGIVLSNTSFTIPLNKWTHIALVRNSGTSTVYANGISVLSGVATSPSSPTSGFHVGSNNIGTENFHGKIDEIKVWSTALSQAQIRNYMCKKVEPTHANYSALTTYYRCDASNGQVLEDRTANANNLSLMNNPAWLLSSAPIGNESAYDYVANPQLSVSHQSGDSLIVSDFSSAVSGAHLYAVNEGPILSNIPTGYSALDSSRYFGVFTIGGTSPSYSITYDYGLNTNISGASNESQSGLLKRSDATDSSWSYTRFFTDSVANLMLNCADTGLREFIVGFSNSTIVQGAAIGQNATVYLNNAGIATLTAAGINNGSFDTCGIDSIWIDVTNFSCADTAGTAVVLFVQNGQGYIYTDTVIVTAIDTFAPIVNTQNFTAYLDAFGAYSLAPAEIDNGSADSCGIVSLTLDTTALSCVNIGSPLTVTLTATDGSGNTASASATVTVLDTLAPTITTQNINAYLNGSGMAVISALQIDNGTTDGCGVGSRSLSDSLFNCADIGASIGITFYATDIYGNTDSAVAMVTVLDTSSPVAAAQSLTLFLDGSGQAFTSSTAFDNGSADNCAIASIVASDTVFSCADTAGANPIILTVTDASGNTDTANVYVTVVDTTAPLVVTQNVSVYLDSTGNYSMNAGEVDGGSTDNCNIASLSVSLSTFSCADVGTPVTVTLNATDVSGNANSNTAVVTVLDTISPQIITQNISVYLDSFGNASINASMIDAGTTDACGIDSIYLSNYNYSCANVGANAVTFFALDVNGNLASSIATVDVFDTIAPEVITQNITVYLNSTGLFTLTPAMINNGTWDSCGVMSYALDVTNLTCGNIASPVTVTLTATDVNGNISANTALVSVLDTIAPQIITQPLTIYLDSTGNAAISAAMVDNGTWDSCGVDSTYLDVYTFDCDNFGANTVWFFAVDVNGNLDSASSTITIVDTTAPQVLTQNITVALDSSGSYTLSPAEIDAGSTDACGIASLTLDITAFGCADVGTPSTVTLTVTDSSGNSATNTAIVTVIDTIAPTALAVQALTVYLDSMGQYTLDYSEIDSASFDNCSIENLVLDTFNFSCANLGGSVTVTLTVTDSSGLTDSATTLVTILDTIAPFVVAQNITVYLDSFGLATITAAQVDSATSDACGVDSIYLNNYTFSCNDLGANNITLFAIDSSGNIGSATAIVNVLDTIPAVVITQSFTAYLDINGTFTLLPAHVDNQSWDSCGIASYSLDTSLLSCENIGDTLIVTLTVTDVNGNVSSNIAQVFTFDTLAPTIITQSVTIYLDSFGNASISASSVNNGTWDSCGVGALWLSDSLFNCADTTGQTITLFATDIHGNTDSLAALITILDTLPPVVLTNNLSVYLNDSGEVNIIPSQLNNGSADNCAIDSIWLDTYTFNCADTGLNNIVTIYASDQSGNIDSNTAIVQVFDTTSPNASTQSITIYLDSFGLAVITPSQLNGGSSDNCGIDSLWVSQSSFDCSTLAMGVDVSLFMIDFSGNASFDSATVTVLDTIAPNVIPKNIAVYLDLSGNASISAAQLDSATLDACGVDSLYLNNYTFNCSDIGANSITLFATDSSGNIGSAAAIVNVLDTIAPTVMTQSFTAYLDINGTFTILPAHVDNQSWDSCGIASYSLDTSLLSCENIGDTLMVTLTVTDVNGNVGSNTAEVFTFDTLAPTIITQSVTIYLDSFGNASISASLVNNGTWDSCGVGALWVSDSLFNCADTIGQTITLFATDIHGNSDSLTALITILDTLPPLVLTNNLSVYLNDSGQVNIIPSQLNNGSADNCAIDSIWLDTYVFSCTDTGTNNIITLYVQDESGNLDSNTAIVQVFDSTSPTVITQNITIYLDSLGSASITANQLDGGSTDNCSINSISISQSNFNCSNAGDDIQVALSIMDFSGNISVDTATVSVIDTVAPNVYTQPLTVALDSFGNAQITTAMVDSGSWDACGIDSFSLSQSAFSCADVGVNTVILSVTDNNGNVNSASALITIIDNIAPQIIAQNLTVFLDNTGAAVIDADSINVGTWDSCGIASLSIDSANFSCLSHDDTIAILFTAEDIHGNISTSTVFVHVLDTMPPVVLAIGDTVFLDSAGTFTVAYQSLDLGTFDNCTMGAIHLSDSTFDCSAVDSAVAIWFIASDSFGNMDSLEVFITVLDSIHPIISCPDSIVAPNDAGVCGAAITFSFPTASDNCSVDTVIQIDSSALVSGSFFPVGFTELFYVAYDQSGNTDTCSFIIEIQDLEAPVIICINDTAICDTTFTYSIPEYMDNCSGFDVVQIAGLPSDVFYPVGVTVNTFEVTDSYGNSDTCSFSVLRYDFPSAANAGPDQRQCEDFDAQLAANVPSVGFGFWQVLNGAGNIADSTDPSSLINSLTYGFDSLEWRIENGVCPIERDTMRLIIDQSIAIANAGTDQTLCDTSATRLAAIVPNIGIGHWEFSYDSVSMDDSLSPEPLVSGIKQGVYTFTWSVENGVCPITDDEVIVRVVPYPLITVSNDVFIFPPTEVTLEASSDIGISFTWQPTDNIQNENEAAAIASPPQTTTYWVTATTVDGCRVTDSVTVFVNTDLEIPTAFTPDGDNINDFWNIKELQSYPKCKVSIFNRWDNLMFVSEGYSTPWDGTYNGEPLPSGAYFFVINLNVGEVSPLTGSITIIK